MNMINRCDQIKDKITDYVLGVLSEQQSNAINEHLSQCRECKKYAQVLQRQRHSLVQFGQMLDAGMAFREDRVIEALDRSVQSEHAKPLSICRPIVKSRITKFATAAAIIAIAALAITFLEKSAPTAYALDQTIKANRSIRYLHFKMFNASHDSDAKEAWIEFDESGEVKDVRVNFPKWISGGHRMVWKEGKTQVWDRRRNTLEFFEDEIYTAKVLRFANRYNPKGAVEHLFELHAQGKVKIEIDEPSSETEPIVVTATYPPNTYLLEGAMPEMREVLFVDGGSKLVKAIKVYELADGKYKYMGVYEYQDYNKPFDTTIFSLEKEVPADVKRVDRMALDIGLPQGDLTDEEIAVKVVREFWKALIAKDYAMAGRLFGGMSADEAQERLKLKVSGIISIGTPVLHGGPASLRVPCKIEIEEGGQVKEWQPKGPFVRRVVGQPDRWSIIGGF